MNLNEKRDSLIIHHNNLLTQAEDHEAQARKIREKIVEIRGQVILITEMLAEQEGEQKED